MPPLAIILLTYQRTDYAVRTIEGVSRMTYDGKISWIVVDDGSKQAHLDAVGHAIFRSGYPYTIITNSRTGYGYNANMAWSQTEHPVTLWLEDDWVLRRQLDITPYVSLLMNRENVGMIRLGHMPVGLDLHSHGHDGRMYLDVRKTQQYAFSGNPHLKHDRFRFYGAYPEGKNPGQTEIAYDHQIRQHSDGPAIWWPLAIGDDPLFGHVGEVQSYEA